MKKSETLKIDTKSIVNHNINGFYHNRISINKKGRYNTKEVIRSIDLKLCKTTTNKFTKKCSSLKSLDKEVESDVIFETELKRYKPGISIKYITKWCQVDHDQFMYFDNKWSANCWLRRPMLAIPFYYIKEVKRVSLNIRNCNDDNLYQLEILIKEGITMNDIRKYTNSYGKQNKNIMYSTVGSSKKEFFRASLENERKPEENIQEKIININLELNNEKVTENESMTSVVEITSLNSDHDICDKIEKESDNKMNPNYISKHEEFKGEYPIKNKYTHKKRISSIENTNTQNIEIKILNSLMKFKNNEEQQDYKKFEAINISKLLQMKETQPIKINKAPTWSQRKKEWNLANERFIFAAASKEKCMKWICVLNWLIKNSN